MSPIMNSPAVSKLVKRATGARSRRPLTTTPRGSRPRFIRIAEEPTSFTPVGRIDGRPGARTGAATSSGRGLRRQREERRLPAVVGLSPTGAVRRRSSAGGGLSSKRLRIAQGAPVGVEARGLAP